MLAFAESALVPFAATILTVEAVLASPLLSLIRTLAAQSAKSMRLVSNERVSDHWKQRALPAYAFKILNASLQTLMWLGIFFGIFSLGLYAGGWVFAEHFEGFSALERIDYMLASLVIALGYLPARRLILRHG